MRWSQASLCALALQVAAVADAQQFPRGTYLESHLVASFSSLGGTPAAVDSASFATNAVGEDLLFASFDPPAGSLLVGYELEACDSSAEGSVNVTLLECPTPGGICQAFANASTGVSETPGCVVIAGPVAHAIDTTSHKYVMQVNDTDESVATTAVAVRLFWQPQLPPAPVVQSFQDVPPSHPFFPHIEGLWGAAATAGCAADPVRRFCPDVAATRGEVAAFLARVLGLYWPLPQVPVPASVSEQAAAPR
jgi:hypothetical protein